MLAWLAYPLYVRRELLWRPAVSALWAAVWVGLLILPSHLVWKPYFVFGVGVGIALVPWIVQSRLRMAVSASLLLFANFTTYEFVGRPTAAYLEAFCSMMAAHLALLLLGMWALRDALNAPVGRATHG